MTALPLADLGAEVMERGFGPGSLGENPDIEIRLAAVLETYGGKKRKFGVDYSPLMKIDASEGSAIGARLASSVERMTQPSGQSLIGLIGAPTSLGLRPPSPGVVPGTAKAPGTLRAAGLVDRLNERTATVDLGDVVPAAYDERWVASEKRLRNHDAIINHSLRLQDRISEAIAGGMAPLVIGGDCGVLVGALLAAQQDLQHGLVHLDGHTDFRNPGNSDACASLAGEDLAAAVGRHWPEIADIQGRGPYVDPACTVHAGYRPDDEHIAEVVDLLALAIPAADMGDGSATARRIRDQLSGSPGYWLHLDVDILDPDFVSAVDSPSPGGLNPQTLIDLLRGLAPGAVGADVTVFDPDLDTDGSQALQLVDIIAYGLSGLAAGR